MPTRDEYWLALQQRVCAKCIDGDGAGNCRLAQDEDCALKTHFPLILEVIQSTSSDKIDPYLERLRNSVCGICIHQSADNSCRLRDNVDCALDRYYPLIVEVIEEVERAAVKR